MERKKTKTVSSQPNISDVPFDQKSPRPPEEGVLNCHTDILTESAQWADSVKMFLQ